MTDFGIYIDEDILLRLEPDDLIRCKSVCKSWYSLISTPRFVKSHLLTTKRHSNEDIGETRISLHSGNNDPVYELVGSSNGLVCISCMHRLYTDVFVVNPSTREVKQLITCPNSDDISVFGFGYDSSIDDFKVVLGHRCNFHVLELKKNIWRSLVIKRKYYFWFDSGILCNEMIHWLAKYKEQSVIASFDLSKEVFKNIPLPKLDDDNIHLGTMKDQLCVFRFPNYYSEEIVEIWVIRNDQVSWEHKLLASGYDLNKIRMEYHVPDRNYLSGHVHIWLLEEGSGAPVLVREIDYSRNQHPVSCPEHIRLSTYSKCDNNYGEHVFVKSLVSPHDMGNENGSFNERLKRKWQNVIPPDGDGRQRLVSSDSHDDDSKRVEVKRWKRESQVFHKSDKGKAKSKRHSHVSSDFNDDGKRVHMMRLRSRGKRR